MSRTKAKSKALNKNQKVAVKAIVTRTIKTNEEKKYKTATFDLFAGTTGALTRIDNVAQGAGVNERIGREVKYSHIDFRYTYTFSDEYNLARIIIFKWKEENVPSTVQILDIANTAGAEWLAPHSEVYKKNYHILYDRTHFCNKTDFQIVHRSVTKKLNFKSRLVGDVLGSLSTNANIYVLSITDSGILPHPELKFAYQLYFTDS